MYNNIRTPYYLMDENLIIKNLEILKSVSDRTGARILLAQKAFSMYSLYPLIGRYLSGTTASSLNEARLGHEEMPGRETHIFAPAYKEDDFKEIAKICDHIIFNSFSQWKKYAPFAKGAECGIRINPEYSEIETEIYNPCARGSRMGVTLSAFEGEDLSGISGLHFHTMCEQNSDTLWRTVLEVEKKFGRYLTRMKWLNFGGGHHITRSDYDLETLIRSIEYMRDKYDLQIYLEPGEAVALNAGFLVTEVLDIVKNDIETAILDTSAACHMPDVLEMPYRPPLSGSERPGEKKYTYRLAGPTCLAGDIIGDYSFDNPLKPGDRLVFEDMAIYTTVKNNTFNGINLPGIVLRRRDGAVETMRSFGYSDFKSRL
ncbi:MAG TPA: carboxynorspermidine decarboxylase [Candidatus Monoglobus merdigallinarum]|uniref:Carboxynorspermidine decarboxylase n=1 Tax=Candidatus Monoglobus merdigallinarum TaxID=2838698 RepID=A0A9D1PRB9_9FIRM|nr:carboxynorspermidine decarboxylase [Candidatus Monoglobus merdigallinarum]